MFAHFWLRQCHMVLRPHLYCLPSRFTIVRYLYWFLGLCGIWSGVSVAFALFARTIPPPVLVFALRRVANVGYAYGVAFFLGSVCLSSACLYPVVAGLVGFSCSPPISGGPCVCVGFF